MTFYTVYKTINTANNRFYIGVHKTTNPNDGYLGSGIALNEAIKKYGRDSFRKEILFLFETSEEAYAKEKDLVTKELIAEGVCYNLTIGGIPSIDWPEGARRKSALRGEQHPHWGQKRTEEQKRQTSETLKRRYRENPPDPIMWEKTAAKKRGVPSPLRGTVQTPESNMKRALSHKNLPKKACEYCGRETSPSNFQRHVATHLE